jgi:F-type H+-transporting ATPase subunit b
MDETLNALGGLLIKALPTFLLLILLHFYLKFVFFRPLEKVLRERSALTEGARKSAESSLETAARKTSEYETALREARSELSREQEEARNRLREEHAASVKQAREQAEAMVAGARAQLVQDTAAAREALKTESEALAEKIAASILEGRES